MQKRASRLDIYNRAVLNAKKNNRNRKQHAKKNKMMPMDDMGNYKILFM